MNRIASQLTIFFEEPFWVGVYERECAGKLEAAKIVFGTEPKDYEVYAFLLQNWNRLRFSPPVETKAKSACRQNPKRVQRAIQKQLAQPGIGTKAQQALKQQHEQAAQERKRRCRERTQEEKDQRFFLRQQKKKAKRRGR